MSIPVRLTTITDISVGVFHGNTVASSVRKLSNDLADFLVALALSSIITDWNTRALNFFQQYSCYLNDIHDG